MAVILDGGGAGQQTKSQLTQARLNFNGKWVLDFVNSKLDRDGRC
jgi:hypothetical protein